jgi:hypothetical protein
LYKKLPTAAQVVFYARTPLVDGTPPLSAETASRSATPTALNAIVIVVIGVERKGEEGEGGKFFLVAVVVGGYI